ncbi:MAG TPA: signal peptidase I, partial [Terriglobales bacterium]|nr:signal peptidase I [Terriglobales bacterium]
MPAGTDTYEIHKITLGEEILRSGGSIRLRVLGTSMLPSVWPGDIVNIEGQTVDAIICGDIVLYKARDSFFVHRLIERSETENRIQWITRGDSMPQADPAVPESHLLGRVSSICRRGRTIIPNRKLTFLTRAAGWVLCHSDSVRSLALRVQSFRVRQR